jgi:hypothetical protein
MPQKERKVGLKFLGEKGSVKVPFTQDLGYHIIIFLMFINNQFLFLFLFFENFKG